MTYQIETAVMEIKEMNRINRMERMGRRGWVAILACAGWSVLTGGCAYGLSQCGAQVTRMDDNLWAVVTAVGKQADGHIGFYPSKAEAKQAALEFDGDVCGKIPMGVLR